MCANESFRWLGGPGQRHLVIPAMAPSALLALVLFGWSIVAAGAETGESASPEASGTPDLRALFRSAGEQAGTRVGRLAIQLVQGGLITQTGLDHRFRTGDTFRFGISSNHSGWLYVMHRSPAGEPQLLWPRLAGRGPDAHLDNNRIWAGETTLVPPAPDVFLFDDEVGSEYFYVLIQPERRAPHLSVLTTPEAPEDRQTPEPRPVQSARLDTSRPVMRPAPAQPKIVQFSVRGHGTAQQPLRGVVLLPGGEDPDQNAYFAPDPQDAAGKVVFEFRLRHED